MQIPWWHTEIGAGERIRLLDAFDRRCFTLGPVSRELAERLSAGLGVRHVVITPSGTAALAMALLAAGVGPGDEVIVPDLTWIATAQAASILGARVVLVDCAADSPVIDLDAAERAITPRTRAIIPVHFHGRCCDMPRLMALAKANGIFVIEDACKAMFCRHAEGMLGTIGHFGCFSMGMISLISSGYGGFIVTDNDALYEKLLLIRDHGMRRIPAESYEYNAFNFKISDLLCAIALGQLDVLEEKQAHLRRVYDLYHEGLAGLETVEMIPLDVESGLVPLCIDLRARERESLVSHLEKSGIQVSRFHLPLHDARYLNASGSFPNTLALTRTGFMPPCGPSQPLTNVASVIDCLRSWRNP